MKSASDFEIKLPDSFLLIGSPGSGKTTLALQFPGVYVMDLDRNMSGPVNYLKRTGNLPKDFWYDNPFTDDKGAAVPRDKVFDRMSQQLKEACENDNIKTIVIDSLSTLTELVLDIVRVRQGRKMGKGLSEADAPLQIQDWGVFLGIMKKLVFWLKSSGKTVCITAHMLVDKDEMTNILNQFIAVPGQFKHLVAGWFSEAWRCYTETKGVGNSTTAKYMIQTVAENRQSHLGLKSSLGLNSVMETSEVIKRLA